MANGQIAPQIIFYNGPAANDYTAARWSFYDNGWTPTFDVNGVDSIVGWTPSTVQAAIDEQLLEPSVLSIDVNMVGNASGGLAFYSVTAEGPLPVQNSDVLLFSAILESHDIAPSSYGVYAGQELMWEPRVCPVPAAGVQLDFTGPYPQTLNFEYPYTLDPTTMTFQNLDVIAYAQVSDSPHTVLNASFTDLPDTSEGVFDDGTAPGVGPAVLEIGPNPTAGALNIYSALPMGDTGTISVFDLGGRVVTRFDAGGSVAADLDTPGVYFVRMQTSSGQILTRSCTVLR